MILRDDGHGVIISHLVLWLDSVVGLLKMAHVIGHRLVTRLASAICEECVMLILVEVIIIDSVPEIGLRDGHSSGPLATEARPAGSTLQVTSLGLCGPQLSSLCEFLDINTLSLRHWSLSQNAF